MSTVVLEMRGDPSIVMAECIERPYGEKLDRTPLKLVLCFWRELHLGDPETEHGG